MKFNLKNIFLFVVIIIFLTAALYLLLHFAYGNEKEFLDIYEVKKNTYPGKTKNPYSIKIMSLNLAHGRKDFFNIKQVLPSKNNLKKNLNDVNALIRREMPDIVAFQEADSSSFLSGNFNHVKYITENSGFRFLIQGNHVQGFNLNYGTAIMSQEKIDNAVSYTFSRSPFVLPKGFVSCSIYPKVTNNNPVTIISLHLDPLRYKSRMKQVDQIAGKLKLIDTPLIVAGDFNCEWGETKTALKLLCEKLKLKSFSPEMQIKTFPSSNLRLDWILISNELYFIKHEVFTDKVSDHLAVFAEIGFLETT